MTPQPPWAFYRLARHNVVERSANEILADLRLTAQTEEDVAGRRDDDQPERLSSILQASRARMGRKQDGG